MQTDHETSIKTVSFLLNDRGVILDHSENLHQAGIRTQGSAIGIEFDTLLQHHSNQWAETYRYYRAQGIKEFTLESIVGNPQTPGDLHIRSLRTGNLECLNVLLSAHPKRFREEPVNEILEDPSKISQLFLRLQRVESRLDSYMKHFPGVFFFQRIDFSFQYVSPNFERLLQFPPDRLLRSGSQFLAMIYDQDRDFFVRELRKNADRREAFTLQFRVRKPRDGSVIYLTDVRSPVYSDSGMLLGYEGVWLDTTRQIIAERKLTSSAWKENLAMLTAGLVHDFSNVMAGIYALSELYHDSMNPEDRMYEGLGQIKKSSMEARKLVRRIIDINREESRQKNYHDPKKLICEQIDLLRIIFPRGTQIDLDLCTEEVPIYIDDVEFRQILLNLAMNAKDALDKPGLIRIETLPVKQGDSLFTQCHSGIRSAQRSGILMRFSDNGSGIPEVYRNRIFHSFFTTKEIHKGSGFGLYNIERMIHAADGLIDFKTTPGEGTTFEIYLPEADFTEQSTESHLMETKAAEAHLQRPFVVVVGREEVSHYDLITLMRSRNWEVIVFSSNTKLESYLGECRRSPNLCLIVALQDYELPFSICRLFRRLHPDSLFALLPMGLNPDELPENLALEMSMICDHALNPNILVQNLENLIRSPIK